MTTSESESVPATSHWSFANVTEKIVGSLALLFAVGCLGIMLLLGTAIERGIGHRGLNILSKLTGIILAALAAQMIMDGVLGFMAGKG